MNVWNVIHLTVDKQQDKQSQQSICMVPGIVGTVVRVDDKTIVKPHEAVCDLHWIGAAVFQRRQQLPVVQTPMTECVHSALIRFLLDVWSAFC